MTLPLPGHTSSRDLRDFANDGDFFLDDYDDAYPDPHPRNTAGCCDGHGQVHHGRGALSYVTLCRDPACMARREAEWARLCGEHDERAAADALYGARSGTVEAAPVRPPVEEEQR